MTAAERIAALEARRTAMQAAEAEARAEQQAADLESLVELESLHGFGRIIRVDLSSWRAGSATMVAARIPLGSEAVYRRFEQTVARAKKDSGDALAAGTLLATACLVYPADKDLLAATIDAAPGILQHVALQIVTAVQGAAEEQKKG